MMLPNRDLARGLATGVLDVPALPPADRVRLGDLDVLVPLYGPGDVRAKAAATTFARWDARQVEIPRVLVAWCYPDGGAPAALEEMPDYPWLEKVRLPQYALADGVFRKEALINLLLRRHATAPYILAIDADAWSRDPHWFRKVRDELAKDWRHVLQPYRAMTDTQEQLPLASLASQVLPGGTASAASQPGLGWGFSRRWVEAHGDESVFNPYLVTGSGDCAFILEHFTGEEYGKRYAQRHVYRYFRSILRDGLPQGKLACVACDVFHENHTVREDVPEPFRTRRYADRAYQWSRRVLDYWGDVRQYVRLDDLGVPVLADPGGPWGRVIARKPELQDRGTTEQVIAEELGMLAGKRFADLADYLAAQKARPDYFQGRWGYMQVAIGMAKCYPGQTLEIGPGHFPVVRRDVVYLDRMAYDGVAPVVVHDLGKGTMPFAADAFAVAVALQVLEHTKAPGEVLADLLRVAPVAVVSLPWQWTRGDVGHVGIDNDWLEVVRQTAKASEVERRVIGTAEFRRIVLRYRRGL